MIVDLPDEFESFVLLDVFEEEESLDLLLLEGEGGGRWRGKGEPGQIIKDQDQGSGLRIKDQDQGQGSGPRTKDQDGGEGREIQDKSYITVTVCLVFHHYLVFHIPNHTVCTKTYSTKLKPPKLMITCMAIQLK